MMSALARKALERAGERFREAESSERVLGSQLIELLIPQRYGIFSRPPGRFSNEPHATTSVSAYREADVLRDSDGSPLFTDKAMTDLTGKPITNSAGEPVDFEPGA